jgi:GntR family transcriptional regulator of arabinose operon
LVQNGSLKIHSKAVVEANSKTFIPPASDLAARLRERIRGGGFALGAPLPTERKLAEQFGISRGTVRRALRLLQREHLIVRQQGRGTFVNSSLDSGPPKNLHIGLLGLMLYDVEYGFTGLVQGACAAAGRRGYAVTTGSVQTDREELQSVWAFIRDNALGVVLAPRAPGAIAYYQELIREDIAVVLADMHIPGLREDYVLTDNAYGLQLATEHLIELGHRRIGYLANDFPLDDFPPIPVERQRGFQLTCRKHGIRDDDIAEINKDVYREKLRNFIARPDRPTGIVAYNDTWAVRVIQTARELGLRVPRDLSVVGFDDSTLAQKCPVPLTTINPERAEMGAAAMDLLIAKIENRKPAPSRGVLITPRLVIRNSTAPPLL